MPILLIDSYDSFTYNVRDLISRGSGQEVITIHNDSMSHDKLKRYLPLFDAIVIGPGPGNPHNKQDVGLIPDLFKDDVIIPILGICLGFQSLCLEHGSKIDQLQDIKHGQVYPITHNEQDSLFNGIHSGVNSVRYHSLYVSELSDEFVPLAFTIDNDKEIIMAAKHTTKPWFGVQYHPESICSELGCQLIENFMSITNDYNEQFRKIKDDPILLSSLSKSISIPPLIPYAKPTRSTLIYEKIHNDTSILEICESLNHQGQKFFLLNSASYPGNWSIIGLQTSSSLFVTHSKESPKIIKLKQNGKEIIETINTIWEWISNYMQSYIIEETETSFPFIGGFMGIFSYEEGEYINYENLPKITNGDIPDTKLVFIKNCIIRNHKTNETYITSLDNNLELIKSTLSKPSNFQAPQSHINTTKIIRPTEDYYKTLFTQCQEYLHSGDSYELNITSQTEIHIPSDITPWEIYKTLTVKNPSPYSAFFEFEDCILISSSPERFIQWDNNTCELRPIKGTVKKSSEMTRARAEMILNTPKEIGENLMIVDLIRHDLYQMLNHVNVSKLMSVEEYSTMYQLVSIIKGEFDGKYSGIDILSRSLPPGSMTGAPKKRSVEILQKLENGRRGLYSGVCGYWSVENKADWSVIIRSLFHYKNDVQNNGKNNVWRIGAGGAVTVLSDVIGEWEELLTKLDSALQVFTKTTT